MTAENGKLLLYADYRGPGPLAYKLRPTLGREQTCPTFTNRPAYSIKSKANYKYNDSPGPAHSYDSFLTNKGRQCPPAYSLQSRPPQKEKQWAPGPGYYSSDSVKGGALSTEKKSPSISMGLRTEWPFKSCAPPSSKYHKPTTIGTGSATTKGAPAWAMKGRQNYGSIYYSRSKDNIPGAGSYSTTEPNTYKKRSGVYSVGGRTEVKEYNSSKQTPGPGSYEALPSARRNGPSIGVRHSDYMTLLITSQDCY